jgi:hypothetical protein
LRISRVLARQTSGADDSHQLEQPNGCRAADLTIWNMAFQGISD